jgi:hypothetical protein
MKKIIFLLIILFLSVNISLAQTKSRGKGYKQLTTEEYNNTSLSVLKTADSQPEKFIGWPDKMIPLPGNQGSEDACIGWSLGYAAMSISLAYKNNSTVYTPNGEVDAMKVMSPAYLYNSINDGKDTSVNIIETLEFAKTNGAVPWAYFPYVDGQYNVTPPDSLKKIAANYRISDYARIELTPQAFKNHLLNGYPIVISIIVYNGMGQNGTDAYENKIPFIFEEYPSENDIDGGHAVCIIGYDDTMVTPYGNGAFIAQNSWGIEWGSSGRFYIPYDILGKNIPGLNFPYIPNAFIIKM